MVDLRGPPVVVGDGEMVKYIAGMCICPCNHEVKSVRLCVQV